MVATTKEAFVKLLKKAEGLLGSVGIEKRLHMFTSIYYGSSWSLDFEVEKEPARNKLFEHFLDLKFDASDDPRPALGIDLFTELKKSQDAGKVDMGHILIGLDARMRESSREGSKWGFGASGLELVTWVGDLGGGSARLAYDEGNGGGNVERYFSGTDYGANSNLEGDIAAYIIGSVGKKKLEAPVFNDGTVAGAFEEYFLSKTNTEWSNRKLRFQEIVAGTASTSATTYSAKIEAFSHAYYGRTIKSKATSWEGAKKVAAGVPHMEDAAGKVASRFVTWLHGTGGAH